MPSAARSAYAAAYYQRNKAKYAAYRAAPGAREKASLGAREHQLMVRYGISQAQYEKMLWAQDGVCAICKRPESQRQSLCVDHCHETDTVIALLCNRCNSAIGLLWEDPIISTAAATYVNERKRTKLMSEITVKGYVNKPKTVNGSKGPFATFTLAESQKQKDGTKKKVYFDAVDFNNAEAPPESSFVTVTGWFSVKEYQKKDGSTGQGLAINVQKLEVAPPRDGTSGGKPGNDSAFSDIPF